MGIAFNQTEANIEQKEKCSGHGMQAEASVSCLIDHVLND